MKEYRSFTEIDRQLKILNLQREIDLEHFKLSLNRFRTDLYPTQLLGGFKGIIQKTVITFILQKLRKIRR
ncbi:DUF6327 family protein [Maribacter sp. TH_r10]|uniref:Uncharacterized protein n=1 Tax=Maribacter luteus TaxID=2594478 RepID=A0A6I2MNP4_9FLAO|nr:MULTISPECIES: DUF6327 family protein [Maribacter]MDV7139552.1 DUF6327 family protein [Maribacter sp. TH_r10]MRX64477.1 hypothetical protein [Maribacter luteus]